MDLRVVRDVEVRSTPVIDAPLVKRYPQSGIEGRGVYNRGSNCPWWIWLLVGLISLLIIGGIIAACFSYYSKKGANSETDSAEEGEGNQPVAKRSDRRQERTQNVNTRG